MEKVDRIAIWMKLIGADRNAKVSGEEPLPGKSNYFIGNDPRRWRTAIPTYAKVKYANVYPGVDLVYYGNQGRLEYDFVVKPGADPKKIRLAFQGMDRIVVDPQGNLALKVHGDEIQFLKPFLYQEVEGVRREISGRYVLKGKNQIGFQIAGYDHTRPLIIDPVLSYSTYLGGNAGTALIYATYLGGNGGDFGVGIAIDPSGNAYVTGRTDSTNFPTTPGAFQPIYGGGYLDAFVTKLNADGSAAIYSSYLGGSGDEWAMSIAVDGSGAAYLTGATMSTDFPLSRPLQPSIGANEDAFVVKVNPTGSQLEYSTFLGGSGDDDGHGIAVDSSGSAYITGSTASSNFPITSGAFQTVSGKNLYSFLADAFVTKINPQGSAAVYSSYLGGSGDDSGLAIAFDSLGNAYVTPKSQIPPSSPR